MLGDGDGCCSCFFVIVVVQCTVVVIRNLDHRFCLINCELIQFLSIGLVACQVEAVISYSVITVIAESYSGCMDLSVVRPSADAVSAACCRCNLWLVAFIKVTLVYCDCQSFVIVVVFSVVYIALIERECYDWGFVIHFDTDFFGCYIVGRPVICGNFYTNIVGVEVIRVDGYMSESSSAGEMFSPGLPVFRILHNRWFRL